MRNRQPASMLLLFAVLAIASRLEGSQSANITPTDVYRHVQAVALDLDRIRLYMGRPRITQKEIQVRGVAPREVIYQAATLCEKVNRLSYELIRVVGDKPAVPDRDIAPADVLKFIHLAHEQVTEIAKTLQLELTPRLMTDSETKTPTDVYRAVVQLNRQINLMLDQRFSPSDVYEQVSLAIAHTATLRSRWSGRRIPPEPDWELGKRPADVYRLLLECLELVRSIAEQSDLQILELSVDDADINNVTPSDVYDIASLLVSELAYLDRLLNDIPSRRRARYPGRKVPSDVFQRVGILKEQLEEINALLESQSPVEEEGR